MKYRKQLFWDVDVSTIDSEKNGRFIIERIVPRGRYSEFESMNKFYSFDRIKSELIRIRTMDPKTHNFCSVFYEIPKNDFKCSTTKPLSQKHWVY